MKKVQIDPATQRRPTSRKQNRSARIKEQLTQQVEVQVIPAKADMEGYERPKGFCYRCLRRGGELGSPIGLH